MLRIIQVAENLQVVQVGDTTVVAMMKKLQVAPSLGIEAVIIITITPGIINRVRFVLTRIEIIIIAQALNPLYQGQMESRPQGRGQGLLHHWHRQMSPPVSFLR
jgi:hypothetical protein